MDALSSIPMGLGASLRAGGMLPPLAEPRNLQPSGPIEIAPSNPEIGLPGIGKAGSGRFLRQHARSAGARTSTPSSSKPEARSMGCSAARNVPLHRVMIATEEASVSFQLMVEVRNKLLEAYQELMRMQV
jgi:flagellar hook-basal body complex protein FliE